MIKTNAFFDGTDVQEPNDKSHNEDCVEFHTWNGHWNDDSCRCVLIVHVGGTCCVTWSIDRVIQIHAWYLLCNVEY